MNGGPWGDLEDDVRKLVVKHRTVWVMCGTLYDIDAEELPSADEPHEVPGAFWKVILAKPVGEPLKVAAFIINQEAKRTDKYADALTTIKAIQDRNELILFPKLPANLLMKQDTTWVKEWEQLK